MKDGVKDKKAHPIELATWLQKLVRVALWNQRYAQSIKETVNASDIDARFSS